jgi:hypothetical protein
MTGTALECRVARLLSREGAFVRRRVDLTRWLAEKVQITDIDVLRYEFSADLTLRRTVVECKSGDAKSAPKEVDRLFWLHGVRTLVECQDALLVVDKAPTDRVRSVAQALNIDVQGFDDIKRRERALGIPPDADWGSHDPQLVAREANILKGVKGDPELQRAVMFLRSDYWHLDAYIALKRTVALVNRMSKRLVEGLPEAESEGLRWLIADGAVCFVLGVTRLAGLAIKLSPNVFRREFAERMSEGLAPASQLRTISQAVDKYMLGVFESAGLPPAISVAAMGAFEPSPPNYLDPLTELIERFAEKPFAARTAALALDAFVGQRIKSGHKEAPDLASYQVQDTEGTLGLIRIALAFLSGNSRLPAFLGDALPVRTWAKANGELASESPPIGDHERPPSAEPVALSLLLDDPSRVTANGDSEPEEASTEVSPDSEQVTD